MSAEDLLGIGKLAAKILDTLRDGGASLLRPWQIRRDGRAQIDIKADEIRRLAAAEKDAEDIKSGAKIIDEMGNVVPAPIQPTSDIPQIVSGQSSDVTQLIKDAHSRMLYRELRREINLRAIVLSALGEVVGNENVSDDRVNDQWTTHWIEGAQDVFDEDLRSMWAKLLAGEVKQPGSYSLHTIAYLRNLSTQDAKRIERVASRALKSYYNWGMPKSTVLYVGKGAIDDLRRELIIELEEEGIINIGGIGFTHTPSGRTFSDKVEYIFQYGKMGIFMESPNMEAMLKLSAYRFTRLGAEIVSLGNFGIDEAYLTKVIEEAKGQGFRVYQVAETREDNKGLHFNEENVVER